MNVIIIRILIGQVHYVYNVVKIKILANECKLIELFVLSIVGMSLENVLVRSEV